MNETTKTQYIPDYVTSPGETLQEILDTVGMSKSELAERIGKTPKTVGEIIKHGAPITPSTAMRLERALGTPASFWNNRERRYRESVAKQVEREQLKKETGWLKELPTKDMVQRGWIKKRKDEIEQLEEVLRFFGVASFRQWKAIWLSPSAVYRQSKAFSRNPAATSVWLRKGETAAQDIECQPFAREKFRAALRQIRGLTRTEPEQFETRVVGLCAETGVAVIFVPQIRGVPIYGATRWLTPKKALLQLSLRGKFEDMLWFTFFHEAGHILLHGKKAVFVENDEHQDEKEQQADRFASNFLIPNRAWEKFLAKENYHSTKVVRAFAEHLGISPAIIVGRLQHEGYIPHSHLNALRRRFDIQP